MAMSNYQRREARVLRMEGTQPTKRELEILHLLTKGYSANEVGKALGISGRTVEQLMRYLRARMGAHTTLEAAVRAVREKLIP